MADLRSQLEAWRGRRVWLLGIGNPEHGDDGFGVRLAEELARRLRRSEGTGGPSLTSQCNVVDAGTCPERFVGVAVQAGCEELVFADAVDFGGPSGALLLAGTEELRTPPPGPLPSFAGEGETAAMSHRVPIALLAQYAEGLGARACLLGVQPRTLRPGDGLSPEVEGTLRALVAILARTLGADRGEGVHP